MGLGAEAAQGSPRHREAGGAGVVHSEDEMSETRGVGRLACGAQLIREGTESGPDAQPGGFSSAGSSQPCRLCTEVGVWGLSLHSPQAQPVTAPGGFARRVPRPERIHDSWPHPPLVSII